MNSETSIDSSERIGLGLFHQNGFEILHNIFPAEKCDRLAEELTLLHQQRKEAASHKLGGLRNLLRSLPQINELANSIEIKAILEKRLNKSAFPIRALFFDKTPDANWHVAWHQDLTIAVAQKIETPGFRSWSVKEEIIHVQPPCKILEGMATFRLHLDDCIAENGALKVIPGSHWAGRLTSPEIRDRIVEEKIFNCEVPKGGVVLMRPLLLHSSSPSKNPSHRRVLHIEYATDPLPNGLKWHNQP